MRFLSQATILTLAFLGFAAAPASAQVPPGTYTAKDLNDTIVFRVTKPDPINGTQTVMITGGVIDGNPIVMAGPNLPPMSYIIKRNANSLADVAVGESNHIFVVTFAPNDPVNSIRSLVTLRATAATVGVAGAKAGFLWYPKTGSTYNLTF